MRRFPLLAAVALIGSVLALGAAWACGSSGPSSAAEPVHIDGSSTVYPLTVAVAGAGFERFCKGETDIQDASRPIEPREIEACKASAVGYLELPVALDAVTVIVPTSHTWARSPTTSELKALWEPAAQGKTMRWRQVRVDWPDEPIALYGPGQKSGTFDFFTHAIVGTERASRTDYRASENDDEIVKGVADHPFALGYVGFVHYERHRTQLKAAGIDDLDQEIGPEGSLFQRPDAATRSLEQWLDQ